MIDRRKHTFFGQIRLVKATVTLMIATLMVLTSLSLTANAEVSTLDLNFLPLQGFEGSTFPPTNWEVRRSSTHTPTWQQSTDAYQGTYSAWCPMNSRAQNETLITPPVDLTNVPANFTRILLVFYAKGENPETGELNNLYLRVDTNNNGNIYDPVDVVIWNMKSDVWNHNQWKAKVFDVTAYRGSIIRFAWVYVDSGLGMYDFYLDNVLVYAPEVYPSLDIGEISYGAGINAVVMNTGPYVIDNVSWTMNMTGGMMGRISIASAGTIATLNKKDHKDDRTGISMSGQKYFGFGRVDITITATAHTVPVPVIRHAKGFVIMGKCYPLIFSNASWLNIFH